MWLCLIFFFFFCFFVDFVVYFLFLFFCLVVFDWLIDVYCVNIFFLWLLLSCLFSFCLCFDWEKRNSLMRDKIYEIELSCVMCFVFVIFNKLINKLFCIKSGDGGHRSHCPFHAKEMLYHLSYIPILLISFITQTYYNVKWIIFFQASSGIEISIRNNRRNCNNTLWHT